MKVVRIIGLICSYICMALLAIMALLITADVLSRIIFKAPIQGGAEWAQVLLVSCMTSLGASIMTGSMVDINMLTKRLKPKAQLILEVCILIVSFVMIVLIAYQQFIQGSRSLERNVVWTAINFPQWPFLFLFGISYAVAALTVIMTIIRKIVVLVKHGNYNEENQLGSVDWEFAFGKYGMSIIGKLPKKEEGANGNVNPLASEVKEGDNK